ncbi:RICIN domain-containing protein [Actinomadura harenae]|uniref:Ricin B lectin domain-containing protein n=1 Tax=Actinomadura harenae TaxID=2483351 RepID=A0A3M2M6S9_9ACTN|nr:ricin-type beta-trefoil lectin domain protein [Actinomadura harenae]RMI44680.1 hypothetical protein EBO15_12045 [Actinomadura harenae]
MKRKLTAVALAAATVTGGVVAATPAQAAQFWNFRNAVSGACLDSNANGSAYVLACNGGAYQKWEWVSGGANSGKLLKNRATGRCLAYNDQQSVSTQSCASGSVKQSWFYNTSKYYLIGGGYSSYPDTALKLQFVSTKGLRVIQQSPPNGTYNDLIWHPYAVGA